MARAVGIDLGTTNSCVAVLEGGDPVVVANSEGSRTTPSVVAFARNGEVLVGQPAKNQAVTNVDRTIRSVKRHMGTDWSIEIDGKDYTAQEISARVLQKLKRDARKVLVHLELINFDRSPRRIDDPKPTTFAALQNDEVVHVPMQNTREREQRNVRQLQSDGPIGKP